jgi:Sjoegren syndrome nuclear autoantigen 1
MVTLSNPDSLNKKYEIKDEFDKVINNTEGAFIKLLESSQTLLTIVKRDESHLMKKIKSDK